MNVQKKKDKFLKRLGEAQIDETVKVITFKRKHFNDELSTSAGFGFQDLKDEPKEFYKWLLSEDYNIEMRPNGRGDNNLSVDITLVKRSDYLELQS